MRNIFLLLLGEILKVKYCSKCVLPDTRPQINFNYDTLTCDACLNTVNKKGENYLNIPGKNNFTIIETNVIQNPEQHLTINFSDPLQKQQNFAGLVTLQNVKNPK